MEDTGILGRTARVPALRIYSESDHYIPATLGRRVFEAYVASGASAQLRVLQPFGVEGHAFPVVALPNYGDPPLKAF